MMTSTGAPDEPQEPQEEGQSQEAIRPTGPLRRYWRWIALAAAIALVGYAAVNLPGRSNAFPAAGVNVSASAGAGATGATGGPSGGAVPNPDATESVPTAIPGPAGVATSAHLPRKLASSLARWKAGGGGAALSVLSAQMGNAMQAGGLRLYPTMRLACTKVGNAVTAARASPPIPDAAMQRWYTTALTALARAAADCRTGISVHPYGDENTRTRERPRILSQSRAEFATGARDLFLATGKIRSL
jgi:hypothetical protein